MKAFAEQVPFVVRAELGSNTPVLFEAKETETVEQRLLRRLDGTPEGGLVVIDCAEVKVSSEAARQLLRRAFRRITGGELPDRYFVVIHLGHSRYNIQVMLESEELTVVERPDDDGPSRLFGKVEPAMQETYDFLCSRAVATAKDVFEHFSLNTISAATNRLTNLSKLALARRVEEQPVAGGGRQYVYAAVR